MKIVKDITISVVTELLIFGIPAIISKNYNMDNLFIILISIGISIVIGTIAFILLIDRLKRFNRQVSFRLHSLGITNRIFFAQYPELEKEYYKKLQTIIEAGHPDLWNHDDLYLFDKDNPIRKIEKRGNPD